MSPKHLYSSYPHPLNSSDTAIVMGRCPVVCMTTNESDIDSLNSSKNNQLSDLIDREREMRKLNKDFVMDMEKIRSDFVAGGIIDKDGNVVEDKVLQKGNITKLKEWSSANSSLILEIADNGKRRVFERTGSYEDVGDSFVRKRKLETAEDDRVIGIPYAQAMAGDRVYIINGRVFTGWALYFSLSSIKSPEDYARNVDLAYNVPYLYASILLKAQLGLGCGFDVNYGSEDKEVAEETLIRKYLFDKLNINTQKLVKTGFHLGVYGNAYWACRRNKDGIVDKVTILQPERLKIFLDPMTTKILFYIYLPPIIGGTTIASYPSDGRFNPNILTGTTLSYPTPIVMHPEDVLHFKINDFTEYPFGFSEIKFCADAAVARMDVNILAPILFKKYAKPMIHWRLNTAQPTPLSPSAVKEKSDAMVDMLQNMEPGSDPVTTERWEATVIDANGGKADIFELTKDMDTQIFAAHGVPETYFKPQGSTDRMISEQDKTFISRLKVPQSIVAEQIEDKLIKPRIDYELRIKHHVDAMMGKENTVNEFLREKGSALAEEPKYPEVVWSEIFKQDETQTIANTVALLTNGIIDVGRAAQKVGEKPLAQQLVEDMSRESISEVPLTKPLTGPSAAQPIPQMQQRQNMEQMRGGLNVTNKKDESNRNVNDVEDPNYMGGSRYKQAKLVAQDDSVELYVVRKGV